MFKRIFVTSVVCALGSQVAMAEPDINIYDEIRDLRKQCVQQFKQDDIKLKMACIKELNTAISHKNRMEFEKERARYASLNDDG